MNSYRSSRSSAWTAGALALALMAFSVGCAEEVPQDPDIERTSVVFDPATSTIPLPSDLALEDDGTLPNNGADLPVSAQADFYAYVGTLHGWLPDVNEITIPLSDNIDASSLSADQVRVFQFNADGTTTPLELGEVTVAEVQTPSAEEGGDPTTSYQISATIETPLTLATKYGFVLAGDLKDTDNNPVIRSQAIHFATFDTPLVDSEGVPTVGLLEGQDETAQTLEGLRTFLEPTVTAALAADPELSRADILSAGAWHTATDAFAVFDPTTGEVPFPNEFVRTGPNGEVTLPVDEGADDLTKAVINELNTRNGFSSTADGWLPFSGAPLDPATVNPSSVVLARTVGGFPSKYEDDRYFLEYQADWNMVTYGPTKRPFDANEGGLGSGDDEVTAGLITTDLKDVNGLAVKPSSAFVFLRSKNPIADENGKSLVAELDDTTAATLEQARNDYNELFTAAFVIGYGDRKEIANAWAFQTDRATDYQQKLNARATALINEGGSPSANGDAADAEVPTDGDIGIVQESATFTTKNFLNPENPLALLDEPVDVPVSITVSVPDTAISACGTGPFPIVILGHGLLGERADAVETFADELAAEPYCMASVALDFPLHGERAVEGAPFLSANVIATKNNFLQAVVDLTVLTEVIKENGLEEILDVNDTFDPTSGDTGLIDEDSIGYAGQSLGAMLGTNFVATNEDVTVAALNVPGARLTQVVLGGSIGALILNQLPETLVQGTFDFFRTFSLLQAVIEPGDPWTFAPHVVNSGAPTDKDADKPLFAVLYDIAEDSFSLGDRLSTNQVMVQMAGADTTVPNATTELLAGAIGVSLEDTTFPDAQHSFLRGDDAAADCGKAQVATWLSTGLAGTAELSADQKMACNP